MVASLCSEHGLRHQVSAATVAIRPGRGDFIHPLSICLMVDARRTDVSQIWTVPTGQTRGRIQMADESTQPLDLRGVAVNARFTIKSNGDQNTVGDRQVCERAGIIPVNM